MKTFNFVVAIFLLFTLAGLSYGQGKTIAATEAEQQALIQAYTKRQQTQQKLEEQKKLAESILEILKTNLKAAQAEDENAVMTIRNIELQIGNAHGFNPEKYEKTDKEGKLVYVEKVEPKKENEKDSKKGQ